MNKGFYKFCINVIRPIIRIFYPYEVHGVENLSGISEGYILCSNHLSNVDPIFLAITHTRPIFFMAKVELFKNKLLGLILKKLGVFPIKRGKADINALEHAMQIPKSKEVLGIFIEGTRSKTGEFLRPRSGVTVLANKSKCGVVPVCVTGSGADNKIRIFKKTTISYGMPIDFDKILIEDNNRKDLKEATNLIMENIKELRSKYNGNNNN